MPLSSFPPSCPGLFEWVSVLSNHGCRVILLSSADSPLLLSFVAFHRIASHRRFNEWRKPRKHKRKTWLRNKPNSSERNRQRRTLHRRYVLYCTVRTGVWREGGSFQPRHCLAQPLLAQPLFGPLLLSKTLVVCWLVSCAHSLTYGNSHAYVFVF